MDIRTALVQLAVLQQGLAITSPVAATIKRAYPYFPKQDNIAPDCPCFLNDWTLVSYERASQLRIQLYDVHMQLLVDDADLDRAADIATAFHVAFLTALDAATTFAGIVTMATPRGGVPTLARLERAGRSYIGLDLHLDVTLKDAVTFAA